MSFLSDLRPTLLTSMIAAVATLLASGLARRRFRTRHLRNHRRNRSRPENGATQRHHIRQGHQDVGRRLIQSLCRDSSPHSETRQPRSRADSSQGYGSVRNPHRRRKHGDWRKHGQHQASGLDCAGRRPQYPRRHPRRRDAPPGTGRRGCNSSGRSTPLQLA